MSSVSGMLYIVKDLGERASQERPDEDWIATMQSLQGFKGPLDLFKLAFEKPASKLEPVSGLKRMTKTFVCTFEEKEILSIFEVIRG